MSGWVFLGLTSTKQRIKCLAQGHNPVSPMRLEPTTPPSPVKNSTTEPSHSSYRYLLFSLFQHSSEIIASKKHYVSQKAGKLIHLLVFHFKVATSFTEWTLFP